MMGYTHIPGGIVAGLTLATCSPSFSLVDAAICGIFGGLGGLFPDIDRPNSKISKKVPLISWVVSSFCPHRGPTHTLLLWLILLGAPLFFFPQLLIFSSSLFVGVASHLILDACTPSGCNIFAPFISKKLKLAKIKTGSLGEKCITVLLYIISIGLVLRLLFIEFF